MSPRRTPRTTLSVRRLALVVVSGLGAILGACSETSEPASGPGRYQALVLQRVEPLETEIQLETHKRLAVPEALEPWQVDDARGQVKPLGEGAWQLDYRGRGVRKISVPGPHDPSHFSQIIVAGVFRGVHNLQIRLKAEGKATVPTEKLASTNRASEQQIVFNLPRLTRVPYDFDELELEVMGPDAGFALHSIDLINRPMALNLPVPEDGEGPMTIHDQSRMGVGLANDSPLYTEFDAQAGDRLQFSYGQANFLAYKDREPTLHVELEGGGQTQRESYELGSLNSNKIRWHDAKIALDKFAGERVRATFSIEIKGDLLAMCGIGDLSVARPAEDAPAVLFITSDTHRADHVAASGLGVELDTPVLDALAERGLFFEQAWSSTNVTSPSHVALMTGVHPRDTQVVSNTGRMANTASADTLAEVFRANGYRTFGVTSVRHLGPRGTGLGQGFDRMTGPNSDTWTATQSLARLNAWLDDAPGQPVFVWLHLFDAHHPYTPPKGFDRRYYPEDEDPDDPTKPIIEGQFPADMTEVRDVEFPKAQYRAEVTYLDSELKALLDQPRFKNGIIAVTSDHGEILEMDGSYFNHSEIYPATLHVPLILTYPGVEPRRVSLPVTHTGIGRTLLNLAGLRSAPFPGDDLTLAASPDAVEAPRFALSAHGNSASVTQNGWYFLLHLRAHRGLLREQRKKHEGELYNLTLDPNCGNNVIDSEPELTRRMRGSLIKWLTDSSGQAFLTEGTKSAAEMEQLAALGYATETEEASGSAWFDSECTCEECEKYAE